MFDIMDVLENYYYTGKALGNAFMCLFSRLEAINHRIAMSVPHAAASQINTGPHHVYHTLATKLSTADPLPCKSHVSILINSVFQIL